MAPKKHTSWLWLDTDGEPRFVGWGWYDQRHPAKRVWALRNAYECELNDWLRTLTREPDRDESFVEILLSRNEASAIANLKAKELKEAGHDILDSRPYGTKKGGGRNRYVIGPDFVVYKSVRKAAEKVGVNASTITRWCQTPGSDWDFLDN